MRKNNNYVPSERQLTHVREVLDLMRVLTGDDRFTEHVDEFEKSKEAVTMCKVLDEVENKGVQRGEQNAKVIDIKNLMANMKWTIEQAMDALSIPSDQRSMYAGMVNKK